MTFLLKYCIFIGSNKTIMASDPNKIARFWTELKRRKVVKVVIVYAGAAYVIIELVNNVAEPLRLPGWFSTMVILLLAIGFPIVAILSWIFDITPQGIEKTSKFEKSGNSGKSPASNTWRIATYISIVIIVVLIGFNLFRRPERVGKNETMEKSIAVLPFKNLSGNSDQVYFVEGMHDELISDLSGIKSLKVISRTSVMRYQDTKKSIPEIARELNVDVLLEGSVLRIGKKIRINAQLINGSTDVHLWAEHYDYQLQDAMSLISDVTRDIAAEIDIILTPKEKERLTNVQSVNPEALEYYQKGQYYYYKLSLEADLKASVFFQKAIDADTNFAKAYVGLANCYSMFAWYGKISNSEASLRVNRLIDKALQLDDQLAEAHLTLATVKFYQEWDFPGAKKEFERAIELNPNLVGNNEYPWYLVAMRRYDESIVAAKRALRLDPYSSLSNFTMARVYDLAGLNNEAIEQYHNMLELGLDSGSVYYYSAKVYFRMGMFEKAVNAWCEYMACKGSSPELIESMEQVYRKSGPEGFWIWRLNQLKERSDKYPLSMARIYIHLGKKEKALDYLEKAWQRRERMLFLLYADPDWIPLREEPSYQALIDKMGFEL